jgi:hypothetical protein
MSTSWVKRRLRAHGFWPLPLPINNGYGPISRRAVRKFQAAKGLEVDGVVGPQTTAALKAEPLPRRGERARAVAFAASKIGVVEHPAGSNKGPGQDGITAMQNASIGFDGQPWCQCFVSYALEVATKGRLKASTYGGYTVSVVQWAKRRERRLSTCSLMTAKPGDWCYFNFKPGGDPVEHVGMFLSYDARTHTVTCIEGNTSSGDSGSQDNGGGCFKRTRSANVVPVIVRVPYRD